MADVRRKRIARKRDEMAWENLIYTDEQELRSAFSDLVTVTSVNSVGINEILGTGFPLISNPNAVVIVSALHVVEHAYHECGRTRHEKKVEYSPDPTNDRYIRIAEWVQESGDLKCSFVIGDQLVEVPVRDVCLRPPLDMALLVVESPCPGTRLPVFMINSDPLAVDDRVVLTTYVTLGSTRNLVARLGRITAVDARGPLVRAPLYTTSIPVEPGCSGGPMFRYNGSFDGPKQVVGVVSSDFSLPEAFTDCSIDGVSRVSMICSAAPLQLSDPRHGKKTIQELSALGLIRDGGTALKDLVLTYNADGTWQQKVPMRRRL